MSGAISNVVVARLAASAPKRLSPSLLQHSMTLGDAFADQRVRPRDWSRLLRHSKDANAAGVLAQQKSAVVEALLREEGGVVGDVSTDLAQASRKLALLVQSVDSWEHALRLASLSLKLNSFNLTHSDTTHVATSSQKLTASLATSTALTLPGATRRTLLHLYRTLVLGGKVTEASHLLTLNAAQVLTSPQDQRGLQRRNYRWRRQVREMKAFRSLVDGLLDIQDMMGLRHLHGELTSNSLGTSSVLRKALGPAASLALASRVTEVLLRASSAQQIPKMERAAFALRLAAVCPGGALPHSIRSLLETTTPPPPVSRRLLSALDRQATDAAFLPWSTVQDHNALWSSPLAWLLKERALVDAHQLGTPGRSPHLASPSLARLKGRLQANNSAALPMVPPQQVHDVLVGVSEVRAAMRAPSRQAPALPEQQQQHPDRRRVVQRALSCLLSSPATSPKLKYWLLSSAAQRSSLCRMSRSLVAGSLLAFLAREVAEAHHQRSSGGPLPTSYRQLDRLTMSCARLWRRSSVGRHRLLESARRAEGQRFAAVVEVVLNVVSTLTERHKGTLDTSTRRRHTLALPRALRESVRKAWVAGWESHSSHDTMYNTTQPSAATHARTTTKDVCCILARELLVQHHDGGAKGGRSSCPLAALPLPKSICLLTSLHEAGLPFQDVKALLQRMVASRAATPEEYDPQQRQWTQMDATFLLNVVRLGSARHYRAVTAADSSSSQFPSFRAPTRSALIALQSLMKHCASMTAGQRQHHDGGCAAISDNQRRYMETLLTTFVRCPSNIAELIPLHFALFGAAEGSMTSEPQCSDNVATPMPITSIEEHLRLVAAVSVVSNSSDADFVACAAAGMQALLGQTRVQRWMEAEGFRTSSSRNDSQLSASVVVTVEATA